MKRKLSLLALLVVFGGTLSACDKCGNLQELQYPGAPKSCAMQDAR